MIFSVQCKDKAASVHRQYRNVVIYALPAPHYCVEKPKKNQVNSHKNKILSSVKNSEFQNKSKNSVKKIGIICCIYLFYSYICSNKTKEDDNEYTT